MPTRLERQLHSLAPELKEGMELTENEIEQLVSFLKALTDPNASDLRHLIPEKVPSGLELDPLPKRLKAKIEIILNGVLVKEVFLYGDVFDILFLS